MDDKEKIEISLYNSKNKRNFAEDQISNESLNKINHEINQKVLNIPNSKNEKIINTEKEIFDLQMQLNQYKLILQEKESLIKELKINLEIANIENNNRNKDLNNKPIKNVSSRLTNITCQGNFNEKISFFENTLKEIQLEKKNCSVEKKTNKINDTKNSFLSMTPIKESKNNFNNHKTSIKEIENKLLNTSVISDNSEDKYNSMINIINSLKTELKNERNNNIEIMSKVFNLDQENKMLKKKVDYYINDTNNCIKNENTMTLEQLTNELNKYKILYEETEMKNKSLSNKYDNLVDEIYDYNFKNNESIKNSNGFLASDLFTEDQENKPKIITPKKDIKAEKCHYFQNSIKTSGFRSKYDCSRKVSENIRDIDLFNEGDLMLNDDYVHFDDGDLLFSNNLKFEKPNNFYKSEKSQFSFMNKMGINRRESNSKQSKKSDYMDFSVIILY